MSTDTFTPASSRGTWTNWGCNVTSRPSQALAATSVEQLQQLVSHLNEGDSLRMLGAGHSFSGLAASDGLQVTIDALKGVISTEPLPNGNTAVTFHAGTRLRDIPTFLAPYDLALPNQGDVDPQSLAGAISTGTHGTGLGFTGFAGLVRGFTIVTADGKHRTCSPTENTELFTLGRVGLGVFGIITSYTLECVPRFLLRAVEQAEPLAQVLDEFPERCAQADHFEFYWFPYTDTALTKTNTRLPWGPTDGIPAWRALVEDDIISNLGYEVLCRLPWRKGLNSFSAKAVAQRTYTDVAHKIFVSPRRVHFTEMEYAIPLESFREVFDEMRSRLERAGLPIEFPWEVRCAAADDVPQSTAYQRASAYIAVHRYWRRPYQEYFALMEPVLVAAGGRPHWGKVHTLGFEQLSAVHPELPAAAELRAQLDPKGVFLNPETRRVFGVQ